MRGKTYRNPKVSQTYEDATIAASMLRRLRRREEGVRIQQKHSRVEDSGGNPVSTNGSDQSESGHNMKVQLEWGEEGGGS